MQPVSDVELDRIFQALSDATRRSILHRIAAAELTVSQLAAPYDLSLAAVSKHLKVLEQAKLIGRRKDGSFQMISLNPDALKTADQWLRDYRHFWSSRLSALKTLLEEKDKP